MGPLPRGARRPALLYSALCLCTETTRAIDEGRFAEAERLAAQALNTGRRVVEDIAIGAYGMLMFCLRRQQGRLGEALPALLYFVRSTPQSQTWRPGLALLYAELGMTAPCRTEYEVLVEPVLTGAVADSQSLTALACLAEVCVELDDAVRAPPFYALLAAYAGSNFLGDSSGPCLGSADRLLGMLATLSAKWEAAERHFEAALVMDTRTASHVWLAHSRYRYALMLHRRSKGGDTARARALLEVTLAESERLGMAGLSPKVKSLLQTINTPGAGYICGLTGREVEVLRLIAMGRNNREIGQVLQISPNTVANHVRSILEKTYTANRTEAAAFARREGLCA